MLTPGSPQYTRVDYNLVSVEEKQIEMKAFSVCEIGLSFFYLFSKIFPSYIKHGFSNYEYLDKYNQYLILQMKVYWKAEISIYFRVMAVFTLQWQDF